MVARAWDCAPTGTPMFVAATKLKNCKKQLKSWSRVHFGNVKKQIKQVKIDYGKLKRFRPGLGSMRRLFGLNQN